MQWATFQKYSKPEQGVDRVTLDIAASSTPLPGQSSQREHSRSRDVPPQQGSHVRPSLPPVQQPAERRLPAEQSVSDDAAVLRLHVQRLDAKLIALERIVLYLAEVIQRRPEDVQEWVMSELAAASHNATQLVIPAMPAEHR